jgi:hypothetical protein
MQQKTTSKTKRTVTKQKKEITFPLEKENFVIIGAGIIVIILGYILMSQNSVDGFLPTVVSPIVLLLGYCVIIPYGILKKSKKAGEITSASDQTSSANVTTSASGTVSSNIKTG